MKKNIVFYFAVLLAACNKIKTNEAKNINKELIIEQVTDEETLNEHIVIAPNGLSVRNDADLKGVKTNLLPYNTKVSVIKKTDVPLTINDNGFEIKGHWVQIDNDSVSNRSYVFNGYLKTIKDINVICDQSMRVSQEKTWDDFYGVYQFSDNIIGITILDDDNSKLDFENENVSEEYFLELLNYENNKHLLYNDTFLRLFKNKFITSKYNKLIGENFYIYCSNKVIKTNVQDVLFHTDECSSSFIMLKLDKEIFNESTGIPLYASQRKLEGLEFGAFKKEQSHYNYLTDICNVWRDCSFINDNGHITLFMKYRDYYFGFRNDTNYNDENEIEPYRYIVSFKDDKLNYHLSSYLDLFGCPCL